MLTVQDDLKRTLTFEETPSKIISCVPSLTELLYYFELDQEVIGITKFCIHPEHWFQSKNRIGGTKNLNIEKIRSIQPDLIIASKEENTKEQIEALSEEFPVYITDISNWEDCILNIKQLGLITDKETIGDLLIEQLNKLSFPDYKNKSVAYIIWNEPIMTIGNDTFIQSIINKNGLVNCFEGRKRYPTTSYEELRSLNPDLVFLSSEPFPFKLKHMAEFQKELPNSQVKLVDGEKFSWYGPRLLHWNK